MKFGLLLVIIFFSSATFATTKGLSQIVTPDIQDPGDLSLSIQAEHPTIGNSAQVQGELGVVPWFEAAAFEGLHPGEGIFGAEFSPLQKAPYLLSGGFINYSAREGTGQPFLESGYYTSTNKWMLGGIVVRSKTELILGWAYDFNSHWRGQIDYQSGNENYATIGFTYTWNEHWQANPALYMANSSDKSLFGYVVVTYTFAAWDSKYKKPVSQPEAL